MKWPDFFIVGAPKAGTTTLDAWLRRIPGVAMASTKEPHYFAQTLDLSVFLQKPVESEDKYLALWMDSDVSSVWGEASPTYLVAPNGPSKIAKVAPRAKIVIAMRNPVTRAFSHFRYREIRTGRSRRSFSQAIRQEVNAPVENYNRSYLLEPGYYGRHLDRWQAQFDSISVIWFDDIIDRPSLVLAELCSFLGVENPENIDTGVSRIEQNQASSLRWAWLESIATSSSLRRVIQRLGLDRLAGKVGTQVLLQPEDVLSVDSEDRAFLEDLYTEDQEQLRTMLRKNPPWFNGQWVRE